MNITDHRVIYVGTTASVLDEIKETIGSSMRGDSQIFADVEHLNFGNEECCLHSEAQRVLDGIQQYSVSSGCGGDVIMYKE